MMNIIVLNDKPAVKIKAQLEWDNGKSILYNCEGDKVWIPKKVSQFNKEEGTLTIEKWFYDKLVAEKKL